MNTDLESNENADQVAAKPGDSDNLRDKLARKEAREEEQRRQEELAKLEEEQELARRRENAGSIMSITSHGSNHWTVEISPTWRRQIEIIGTLPSFLFVWTSILGLAFGFWLVRFSFNPALPPGLDINFAVWGGLCLLGGLWMAFYSWKNFRPKKAKLSIEEDTYFLEAPSILGGEGIGRLNSLHVTFVPYAKNPVYEQISISTDDGTWNIPGLTSSDTKRLGKLLSDLGVPVS